MANQTSILTRLYNACNPFEPADEAQYLDCAQARGDSVLTQELQRRLALIETGYVSFLFSGHIGCGKSSNFERWSVSWLRPARKLPTKDIFPVLVNVSDYLDDYDASVSDILLAIVSELAATIREVMQFDIKDSYFVKRFREIKELALSDVILTGGELPIAAAKVKFQLLKKDPTTRQKVREALIPHMSSFLEEINAILDRSRTQVRQFNHNGEQQYHDIVIILDNLEKIRRIDGQDEGLESHRELFLERYTQLTGLKVHMIYTLPLRLVRSQHAPQLELHYSQPFVLPMVKVLLRDGRVPYSDGLGFLRDLIQRRLPDVDIRSIFVDEALDFLLTYSGGNIRHLIQFVQLSAAYSTEVPIRLPAVHRAIQQTIRVLSSSIPEQHWDKLCRLDLSHDHQIVNGDEDYLAMLENLTVLEYIDGYSNGSPFDEAPPWYVVNPIVRELPKFKSVRDTMK